MKLIFLHGPPAAGKLTVGSLLAERTGYRLFHNHYSHDLAESLFEFGNPDLFSLCAEIRLLSFEAAAKANLPGVVFTFAYTNPSDDDFIKRTQELALRCNVELFFVYLTPSVTELEKRIVEPSRQKYSKARTVRGLHKLLAMYDYTRAAKLGGLTIDNSTLSPEEVVTMIVDRFQLKPSVI